MEDTKLLYDTIDARAETILRAADRVLSYFSTKYCLYLLIFFLLAEDIY